MNTKSNELLDRVRHGWIFLHIGRVQLYEARGVVGMLVATAEAAAKVMVETRRSKGQRISSSRLGTVEGETFEAQLAVAMRDHNATGVWFTDDGRTLKFLKAPG